MATDKDRKFHHELLQQLVTLSTSGFGLVAALAWNEAIQTFVQNVIESRFPNQFGILSKLIYAIIITVLAVVITFQLSKLASHWGSKE